jgi:hypothetical protein
LLLFLEYLTSPEKNKIKYIRYNWNIVESGVKHHTPNLNPICSEEVVYKISASLLNTFMQNRLYRVKHGRITEKNWQISPVIFTVVKYKKNTITVFSMFQLVA